MKERFGGFTAVLTHRSKLTQKQIVRFVGWSYFRRLMQAVIILGLYSYPVMQVTLSVKLNLIDLVMLVNYLPYASKQE